MLINYFNLVKIKVWYILEYFLFVWVRYVVMYEINLMVCLVKLCIVLKMCLVF